MFCFLILYHTAMYFVFYKLNMTLRNMSTLCIVVNILCHFLKRKKMTDRLCDHICRHFDCAQIHYAAMVLDVVLSPFNKCNTFPISLLYLSLASFSYSLILRCLRVPGNHPSCRVNFSISLRDSLVGSIELPPTEINQICIIFSNQLFRSPFLSLFPVFIATSSF